MANVKDIADQLVNLTVKEVSELAKILKDEYGIEPAAAAPVMVAGPAGGGAAAAEAVEQTEFDVLLKGQGEKKLEVVKVVKNLTGMGLKEAKDLVDNCPSVIKEKLSKEEANNFKKQLEDAGAVIELK
jgi:large subunit ribosomal protein L7/L12